MNFRSAIILWVIAGGSLTSPAQPFVEISAEIEIITSPGNTNEHRRSFSVVCTTGNSEWRIHHDFAQNTEENWFFDGTNVFNSTRVTKPISEERRERFTKTTGLVTAPFETAKSNLTIRIWASRDGLPLGDLAVNIPWLAFCSGTYLKREGRLIPLPVAELRHTRDRFAYTDKTESFEDAFGLPRTVDLYTSRSLFQVSEDDFDKEYFFGDRYLEWKTKTVSSFQEGVLTFHYAVTQSTNFLGRGFPTEFEFFQNGRKYEQNGNWFCRGSGRVKSIRASARPVNLFEPTLGQTFADHRFRDEAKHVDSIIYRSTNAFSAPTNDPALQETFAAWVKRARGQRPESGSGKTNR